MEYRVYGLAGTSYSASLPFGVLLGTTTQPPFDHVYALSDGKTWSYLVVMSNGTTDGRYDGYYGP